MVVIATSYVGNRVTEFVNIGKRSIVTVGIDKALVNTGTLDFNHIFVGGWNNHNTLTIRRKGIANGMEGNHGDFTAIQPRSVGHCTAHIDGHIYRRGIARPVVLVEQTTKTIEVPHDVGVDHRLTVGQLELRQTHFGPLIHGGVGQRHITTGTHAKQRDFALINFVGIAINGHRFAHEANRCFDIVDRPINRIQQLSSPLKLGSGQWVPTYTVFGGNDHITPFGPLPAHIDC